MNFIEQHKAGIITFLITGIVTFALFSIHITQTLPFVAETYIDLTPMSEEEEQSIKEFLNQTKVSDRAFNEDQSYQEMMKKFKAVPADDFEQTMKALTSQEQRSPSGPTNVSKPLERSDYALNEEERKKYEALKKRLPSNEVAEHSKGASTFIYSLKDRRVLYYDTPRYLCEEGGKVIINIIVKSDGTIKDCYVNGSTKTGDPCLLNTALEYAKKVVFNSSNESEQLGSVTFYFKNKLAQ
jgi:hypothetical protein